MIDSHCHLQTEQFDPDREEIIRQAMESGVTGFIVPAIDRASFDATLAVATTHSNIWCGLGIHPHSATEWNSEVKEQILKHRDNPNVVAVGEIGLDYYYDFAPRETQTRAFSEQIELAKSLQKPIIIHTRDSIDETLKIVSEQYAGVDRTYQFGQFHCFTGTPEQAEKVVELGFAVSFTGNITFKNSTLADTVVVTPLDSMLIETDSPYLAPTPYRGKRNTPSLVRLVAEKIAAIKHRDVLEIMSYTTENAKRIFRLSSGLIAAMIMVLAFASASMAQPGSRPPDSVMTQQRREAEEMIRRQREQLSKEQEIRRQDSIRVAYEQQQQAIKEMQEQVRKDSLRAVERMQDEERARLRAQTPIVWKAIGVGVGIGIGNLSELNQLNRLQLSPTSVFATSFSISSAITRGIDVQLSYNSFTAGDDLTQDNLWRQDLEHYVAKYDPLKPPTKFPYFVPTHEDITTKYIALDFRFVINPHSPVKFYLGLGYNRTTIENKQTYLTVDSLKNRTGPDVVDRSFTRGGIKGIFGARYDLELGDSFILTPFADISATFLMSGDAQEPEFDFRTSGDPITFTHLNAGFVVYFGWWHVKRN